MVDEQGIGQGQDATPDTGQGGEPTQTPELVQIGNEQMTLDNLIKSYQEGRSRWTQDSMELAEARRKLDELSWAPEFQQRYWSDNSFREHMDSYGHDDDTRHQPQVQIRDPRITQIEADLERQKQERAFDQLRSAGLQVSKEDEVRVLREIATNPHIRDVDAAYKKLFFGREMDRVRREATTSTAEHMADAQGSYSKPPRGSSKQPSKPDPRKMSKEDWESAVIDDLSKLDF